MLSFSQFGSIIVVVCLVALVAAIAIVGKTVLYASAGFFMGALVTYILWGTDPLTVVAFGLTFVVAAAFAALGFGFIALVTTYLLLAKVFGY